LYEIARTGNQSTTGFFPSPSSCLR
jgi:hypothetical protein